MGSAWFRGEGGGVYEMSLPLPEAMADQVAKGSLVEVPAPSGAANPAAAVGSGSLERPSTADPKADWVGYAALVSDRPRADLDGLTKAELIKEYG